MTTPIVTMAIPLCINGDMPGGRNAALDMATSVTPGINWSIMQGDRHLVHLFFRRPGDPNETSTVLELPASYSMVLAGKIKTGMGAGAVLFSCTAWEKIAEEGGADVYYEGMLDLTPTEINTVFNAIAANFVEIAIDIEVRDLTNTVRTTYRIDATLYRQAYAGEGTPSPAAPVFFPAGGTIAIPSGVDTLTIADLGLLVIPAQVMLSVRKPSALDANIFATIRDASISEDGFIVDFSAAPIVTGYKLDYLIVNPGGA